MLWSAWTSSKAVGTRPSVLYGIEDPLTAYCFDNAVTLWGTTIENAVSEKTEKSKNKGDRMRKTQTVLNKYLYCDDPENAPGRFRDPMAGRN